MAASHAKHHDYHLVNPSPWPVTASVFAFIMMIGAVIWMRSQSDGAGVFGITGPWVFAVGAIGVIASTTDPFCADCDRARLTADGQLITCLYATSGTDLRGPLRAGASDADLTAIVRRVWAARTDRGAEARLSVEGRTSFVAHDALRARPHLEMHTRGG